MNKPKEVKNISGKPGPGEEQRGIRTAPLFLQAASLGAAVVVCAIAGPKLPPWEGD
jgi:hypothetical protein